MSNPTKAVSPVKKEHDALTERVKDLFNTIGPNDILRIENGKWMMGDKPIDDGKRKLLIEEAANFRESQIYKVLEYDIKHQSNKKMFVESRTEFDMIAGKALLYLFDVINTRLRSLSKGSALFNYREKK